MKRYVLGTLAAGLLLITGVLHVTNYLDPALQGYGYTAKSVSDVPEPTTMLLLGLGLVGLAVVRRKFR